LIIPLSIYQEVGFLSGFRGRMGSSTNHQSLAWIDRKVLRRRPVLGVVRGLLEVYDASTDVLIGCKLKCGRECDLRYCAASKMAEEIAG